MPWGLFKKKSKPLTTDEDNKELRELERTAYMNKARELVKLRGEEKAIQEISPRLKQKGDEF